MRIFLILSSTEEFCQQKKREHEFQQRNNPYLLGSSIIQSLRTGSLGDFMDFRSLLHWREFCRETTNFQSVTHGQALGWISAKLFCNITPTNLPCLTVGGHVDLKLNLTVADESVCNKFKFRKFVILPFGITVKKLPDCCTCVCFDGQFFLPNNTSNKLQDMCNMNPQVTTLQVLSVLPRIDAQLTFANICTLFLGYCDAPANFPCVEQIYFGPKFFETCEGGEMHLRSTIQQFTKMKFPALKEIYMYLSPGCSTKGWPLTLPTDVRIYIHIQTSCRVSNVSRSFYLINKCSRTMMSVFS